MSAVSMAASICPGIVSGVELKSGQPVDSIPIWYTTSRTHPPPSPIGLGTAGFGEEVWKVVDAHPEIDEGRLLTRSPIALTLGGRPIDPVNAPNGYPKR